LESDKRRRSLPFVIFELFVILPTIALLGYLLTRHGATRVTELLVWAVIVAIVELLPVPVWQGVQMSMAFPLLLAVAFLYSPPEAAAVAFVGSFDLREIKRTVTVLIALFNRSQVALSILAASYVFHALASMDSALVVIIGTALLASAVDYVVNMTMVTIAGYLLYGLRPLQMMQRVRIGRPYEFLVSYIGLGMLGMVLALLHREVAFWSIPTFLAPLVFARQMFFRSRALEEAHRELKDREQVLRALSNRMAEERQDERAHIAAYLHDDLAQLLFRLSLQVDIARRHLEMGDLPETESDLAAIRETKNRTSDKIRALIRDLHRSPLGRAGLPEAVESFIEDLAGGSGVRFHTEVQNLPLPPPIQLLTYHIAREAVMNSLKHAAPNNVWITLRPDNGSVALTVRDDGSGFDPRQPGPEGHFGLSMMRERALVAGGTYALESAPGEGTTITVRFPSSVWLEEGHEEAARQVSSTESSAPARQSVPA
jgi:signal transduction histidine kinase